MDALIRDRLASALVCALCVLLTSYTAKAQDDAGFVRIFDGKVLKDWRPVPQNLSSSWSVKDGVIRGEGLEDRLAYLVYAGDEAIGDFELKFQYRMLTNGNTGVEVRGHVDKTGKRPFEGYHADLGHVGIGPQILGAWDFHFATRKEFPSERGTRLTIDESGAGHHETIADHITLAEIKKRDWNRCHIVANGNDLQFSINGKLASAFTDGIREGRLGEGLIAFQLRDKGMVVEFKDILLKH